MDIPVVARWALFALAAVLLLLTVRSLLLARRAAPGHRTGPLLDAADRGLSAVMATGLALPGVQWELAFGALALLGPVLVRKAVHDHRAGRAAKAAAAPQAPAPGPGSPGPA
ncbi:hypothetical protein [Streptomyces sp. NPDC051567]|uniref:hypothetical protein n=1 Tax=Streptomyces sp. NPDC051567 TaxID=3365660 RepID=UPI00379F93B1